MRPPTCRLRSPRTDWLAAAWAMESVFGLRRITEDNSVAMNREGRTIARPEGFDRELLDRDGVVIGWWRLAFFGEPCGQVDVDFWVRFRFVPAPEFDRHRPLFEAAWDAFKAPGYRMPSPLEVEIRETVQMRDASGNAWRPFILRIRGDCGSYRGNLAV